VNGVQLQFGHLNATELCSDFKVSKGSITLECDACIAVKMTKKRSRRSRDKRYEAIAPLQELSTDTVCAGVKGAGGEQFYCSICCHATSFVWILCVCNKDQIAKSR
jgi:hypothetical protein